MATSQQLTSSSQSSRPAPPPWPETQRAQTTDCVGARDRTPSPNTEWQSRILEELALNSRRGGGLPVPHYKRELEPFSSHTFDAASTDCSDGKAPQEEALVASESKKSNLREGAPSNSIGTWLPDVSEVISRLRAGAEGFSGTELERIQSAFQRFKDPDNPEIHKDELPKVLMHLGYTQISEDQVKKMADSISRFPNLEKGEFIYFMEKHVEYEFEAFKDIFERFDEDGNGTLDADELCVFLSSLGFTPLRSIIRESLDLVDLDGNGVLDFEETVILMHVYRHSEGFTVDELQELTSVFLEQQQQAGVAPSVRSQNDPGTLPADRLYHLLLQFFGPRAADFSQDLQLELSSAGRRRSAVAAQGAAGQAPTGPAALSFQEAVLWARRFRERMFNNYREVFQRYDDNNSNSIDMLEVRNVIRDLGWTIAQKTVDELVYEARVRGDIVHRSEDQSLDYDSFVHFMQILNENDGFNSEEIARIQKTFHKFDADGSGDISSIELSDMLRELGQCSRMEEVRSLLSAVDINGNGVLDMREFIRFMRLFREKQLARVKMVFTKQANTSDPPLLAPSQVESAVLAVLSEEAVEIALADGQTINKDKALDFEDFVHITDELREYCVRTSKKYAGYSQLEVDGLRQIFDSFDHKKTGLLRQAEATELLKSLGVEVRSVQERQALSDQIARACDAAREAGVEDVVDQHVNFWVFLQLFRSMRRKQDEESEQRLMLVSEEAKFNSQEVSGFQEVFDHAFMSFVGGSVTSSDQKLMPRTGVYKLLRSMGLRVEGRDRHALDQEITRLNKDGLDFPNFLLLMRWMVDVDFGQISSRSQI